MSNIPILNIQKFEHKTPLSDFYSNDLKTHLEKNMDLFHKPHRHDFFLCVLFSKGSGYHEIDFNTFEVKRGSVFFLRPGQTHYWTFDSPPQGFIFFHTQDFYEFHFSKSKLEQFPFYYTHENTPLVNLAPNEVSFLEMQFKRINDEYYSELSYKKQKIASLIHTTYIDLARCYNEYTSIKETLSTTYIETLRNLEKLIDTHYKVDKTVKFYAYQLNITSKHLNRIVKTTLGKTTTDLITERIILESKRLLVHSDYSLVTISEHLGYRDYAYFSRVFKLNVSVTPLKFRKNYR